MGVCCNNTSAPILTPNLLAEDTLCGDFSLSGLSTVTLMTVGGTNRSICGNMNVFLNSSTLSTAVVVTTINGSNSPGNVTTPLNNTTGANFSGVTSIVLSSTTGVVSGKYCIVARYGC